jgi:predicted lipoprotein with Yx(FWY)xxD motif
MNPQSARRARSLGRLLASLLLAAAALAGTALVVTAAPMSVQLGTRTSGTLGTYLTGPSGHALYTLSSEPKNGVLCVGGCLGLWPPLTVAAGGSVHAPTGVAGTFGTFVRSDTHATQAALNGHALYYYAGDGSATDTNGEGIPDEGGTWHVAKVTETITTYEAVAGNVATKAAATALQAKLTKAGFKGYRIETEMTGSTGHFHVERTFSNKAAAQAEVAKLKAAKYHASLETDVGTSI